MPYFGVNRSVTHDTWTNIDNRHRVRLAPGIFQTASIAHVSAVFERFCAVPGDFSKLSGSALSGLGSLPILSSPMFRNSNMPRSLPSYGRSRHLQHSMETPKPQRPGLRLKRGVLCPFLEGLLNRNQNHWASQSCCFRRCGLQIPGFC